MPWDELTEIRTLGTNVREYVALVKGADAKPAQSSTGIEFPDVSKNVDIDHGQSVYYLFSPALFFHYGDGGARTLMLLWHGYTFLVFMAGVFAIYCIASYLAKDWRFGLVASLLLYLSPRFFAESHYNNKDIMAMVMILLCLWFAIRFIEKKSVGSTLLFALFGALAANMRISGLAFFGLCGVLYLVTISVKREWSWKTLLLGLLAIVSFCAFYAVLTPGTMAKPRQVHHVCLYALIQLLGLARLCVLSWSCAAPRALALYSRDDRRYDADSHHDSDAGRECRGTRFAFSQQGAGAVLRRAQVLSDDARLRLGVSRLCDDHAPDSLR